MLTHDGINIFVAGHSGGWIMPTSLTYDYYYSVGFGITPDGTSTYGQLNTSATTVEDTQDGNSDGLTNSGDNLEWINTPSQLLGFTSNGDPVVNFLGLVAVPSNDPNLSGNLGFNPVGTYGYGAAVPTTTTYNYYYSLSFNVPPDANTVYGQINTSVTTAEDNQDSNSDGYTTVGNSINWINTSSQLVGFTSNGDPIVNFLGLYAVLSNDPNLSGNIGFSDTGTYIFCFTSGVKILTSKGALVVETLAIGDLAVADDGRQIPIKWIGHQTVSTRFGPAERLLPVRFAAGSLGEGIPHSNLTVTADHGMLVSGVICHAGALVNGTTITRVPLSEMGESFTVYHIETEAHEIILANGAPAETFIDNVSRRVFDNYSEFEALYGDVPEMEELPYPRAMSARQVPSWINSKLARKAVA
jgi:hypothetical protein